MKLEVYDDSGEVRVYDISFANYKKTMQDELVDIDGVSKEADLLKLIDAYCSDKKLVAYDKTNKQIEEKLSSLEFERLLEYEFSFIYFTSGTTGVAVGAFKTKENILKELEELQKLFSRYRIEKVVVTVPFVHFYGSLLGAFYALEGDIDIVIKEHFLPNDLLAMCNSGVMVITTPLYIKSLNRLGTEKNLEETLFISSTAPLFTETIREFQANFHADIMQIFGSTESGGIAYKLNDQELWTPIEGVEVLQKENGGLKVASPFISKLLLEKSFKKTDGVLETFDFIEMYESGFKLVGRSSQIIKIAGKRYSTVEIEALLEKDSRITNALVYVSTNKDALRGEELDITLESKNISKKDIKELLKREFNNIRFTINLRLVDEIKTTSIGKKMLIQ